MAEAQSSTALAGVALEGSDLASLLQQEFKPKSDDAKNAVEGMRGRVPASVMPGSAAPKGVDFSAIDAWLKRGKILEAIKAYRDLYPVTLAEAKLAVEQRKSMLGV